MTEDIKFLEVMEYRVGLLKGLVSDFDKYAQFNEHVYKLIRAKKLENKMMTIKIETGEMIRVKFDKVRLMLAGYLREATRDEDNGGDDWSPEYVLECLKEIQSCLDEGFDRMANDVVLQVPEGSDAVIIGNYQQ